MEKRQTKIEYIKIDKKEKLDKKSKLYKIPYYGDTSDKKKPIFFKFDDPYYKNESSLCDITLISIDE
jgi:hypothetical protein